ncbi:UDP-N-acetylmuramoyl-L-alanine--D-glutamate ligase [Candidatus Daviesbacteria bacterium]|nr:UDP-N-acetylmuramoyl-L-alanine--D-glutamate ligase [Candidatus Daviesbacteria bacterium]
MNKFKNIKVLIFGLGLNQGGVGSAQFFAKQGAQVKVTDLRKEEILQSSLDQLKNYPEITYTLGGHKHKDFDWADTIIRNPAVKPGNSFIEYARKLGKRVEQDMGIFLDYVKPEQIIGVTGTKGKSTTASLIYEVLKARGKNTVLAGNIGKSVLDTIDQVDEKTLVVLEISSFQLEAFDQHKVSPRWAIITNIYPDHLNYYKSMDEYIYSKKIIGLYQTPDDFIFINKADPSLNNPEFLKGFQGQIIFYSVSDLPEDFKPVLMGKHNKSNIAATLALGKTFDIPKEQILDTISKFKGVLFRMELIKEWNGIKIYNDTTATVPDAAIQAIKTFPNCILICGGMNKGMDYKEFSKVVDENVKKVFFLEGDSTDSILSSLRSASRRRSNLKIYGPYNDLEKLLEDVKVEVKSGDIILFSPAATSFNLFQNEFDRGRKFNTAVEKLFR